VTTIAEHPAGGLQHEALVYGSDAAYVAALAPLLAQATAEGRPAIAVVPAHNTALLRGALTPAVAAQVEWVSAEDWYQHPIRTIAAYEARIRRLPAGSVALVVGEVQFGTTEVQWAAWTRYESALNRALERHAVRVICPYDSRSLPATVVDDAARTHPCLLSDGNPRPSEGYEAPEALLRDLPPALAMPERGPDVELVDQRSARPARRAFGEAARAWGVPDERIDELSVGVSEVVTNAVLHGHSAATVRVWCDDEVLLCAVEDEGGGTDDVLLGYRPPAAGAMGGYGLWLARQVFDRSELDCSPAGGLRVLLAVDR